MPRSGLSDHPSDGLVELDAHYVVQMENGDLIYIAIVGCAGPPRCKKLNAGEKVDQSLIYFRSVISVETAAPVAKAARSILVSV
jgi:hypothetical protein